MIGPCHHLRIRRILGHRPVDGVDLVVAVAADAIVQRQRLGLDDRPGRRLPGPVAAGARERVALHPVRRRVIRHRAPAIRDIERITIVCHQLALDGQRHAVGYRHHPGVIDELVGRYGRVLGVRHRARRLAVELPQPNQITVHEHAEPSKAGELVHVEIAARSRRRGDKVRSQRRNRLADDLPARQRLLQIRDERLCVQLIKIAKAEIGRAVGCDLPAGEARDIVVRGNGSIRLCPRGRGEHQRRRRVDERRGELGAQREAVQPHIGPELRRAAAADRRRQHPRRRHARHVDLLVVQREQILR